MANVVPAREAQVADLGQHLLAIHGPEVFFLVPVGSVGIRHLTLDHRDRSIAQADFVTGVDDGFGAYGGGVGQIPR